ncbi:MAG: hypothetical protein Q4F80_04345, partial [bacterium]|nr:hypothetical protein [bacterium]
MFLKSVFQNKILINFSFFFCLILSLGLFLISFVLNENNFNIPLLGGKNSDIRINIEGGKNQRVYADGIELKSAPFGGDFNEYKTYEIN